MSILLGLIVLYLKYCVVVWLLGLLMMLLGGFGFVLKLGWTIARGYWWYLTRSHGNK